MTRGERTAATLGLGLGAALLVVGCSPATPRAFTDRSPVLPDCGSTVVEQGEPVGLPRQVLDCLAGPDGGEAVLEAPTAEGDPVRWYVRVGPGVEGVEIFGDTTDDRLGSQEWYRQSCPDAGVDDLTEVNALVCEETEVLR